MKTGDIIRNNRIEKGLTQEELGLIIGVKKAAVQKWESGAVENLKRSSIKKLSEFFNIPVTELLDMDDDDDFDKKEIVKKSERTTRIPILGFVAAGTPIEKIEDIKGYIDIPEWLSKRGNYFALNVKGKSMEPDLLDGDIIVVREQKMVENDEIAVVVVDSEEATVKQIKIDDKGLMLVPFNRDYQPLFFTPADVENKPVTIIGKVVELRRIYD